MELMLLTCLFLSLGALSHGASPLIFEATNDTQTFSVFQDWCLHHGKVYGTKAEQIARYTIFTANMITARSLNARRKTPDDATFGPTHFADLTSQEFKNTVLMKTWKRGSHKQVVKISSPAPPDTFDWTTAVNSAGDKFVVTPVKNQGQAGTCWAFTGLANVESLWARKTDKASPDLSTQALNDCDGLVDLTQGALACGPLGATMPGFYLWVVQEGGLMTWEDYPYCSGDGECKPCAPEGYSVEWCGGPWPVTPCSESDSCAAKYDKAKFVEGLKVKDFVSFDSNEDSLRESLVNTGPLVAGIDAVDMQLYSGGILKPGSCSADSLNHAVLLVGYDVTEGFWRAKNSWGTGWGEDGYLRIGYGTGACGINSDVSSSVLE